jgi:hypothetical protein
MDELEYSGFEEFEYSLDFLPILKMEFSGAIIPVVELQSVRRKDEMWRWTEERKW